VKSVMTTENGRYKKKIKKLKWRKPSFETTNYFRSTRVQGPVLMMYVMADHNNLTRTNLLPA
jgi:hypothetical protein